MKNLLWITSLILAIAVARAAALQTPTAVATASSPCNDAVAADKKKEAVLHDPLLDPVEEMRMRAQKKMEEKNFKELQDAATELAAVTAKMSREIDSGGQFVVSLRVLDELDQIEKLTKRVRSRAK